MIDIKDDFFPEEIIHDLEYCMLGNNFAWFLQDNKLQHNFWKNNNFSNRYNDICRAWIDLYFKPTALISVKGKLHHKTNEIKEHEFNADFDYKHKNCMTSIIYINTNNGYTKFKNGDTVESVRNRLVTFPAHLKHAGSTCTDEEYRCVINLNYYK